MNFNNLVIDNELEFTREQLDRINKAGAEGRALRKAVERRKLTEKQAEEIISRPRLEQDTIEGAAVIPFPRKKKDNTN